MSGPEYTYGNSQAAVNLADMLRRHEPKVSRKVSRNLHKLGRMLNACKEVKDKKLRRSLMACVHETTNKTIAAIAAPQLVVTHALNVADTMYKVAMRQSYINYERLLQFK